MNKDFFKTTKASFRGSEAGFLWCPRAAHLFLKYSGRDDQESLDKALNEELQRAINDKAGFTVGGLEVLNNLAYACHVAYCEYEDLDPVISGRQKNLIADVIGLEAVLALVGMEAKEETEPAKKKEPIQKRLKKQPV